MPLFLVLYTRAYAKRQPLRFHVAGDMMSTCRGSHFHWVEEWWWPGGGGPGRGTFSRRCRGEVNHMVGRRAGRVSDA